PRPATATAQVSALATAAPPFTPAQLTHLQTLLRQQKPAVVAYTDEQAGRLLANGSVQLAATPAALLRRVQRAGAPVKFGLPPEGGFITVEACLIAQDTTKLALVYRFLNLLYQRELLTETVNNLGYLPVFTDLLRNLNLNDLGGYQQLFNPMIWQQLEFFQRRMTRAQASEIWVAVKAS
ncbi:MAG TPA: extracellular solute-binding protein, partial [Candidatus Babeliales bacterium]|nr:extracellular solute-binding protein [Candidatus Babeliales bacterium]